MNLKAIRAREKSMVEKLAAVNNSIETHLEKDAGVVVDCFHHAKDKHATVSNQLEYEWAMYSLL
jgi:hypothetical protein